MVQQMLEDRAVLYRIYEEASGIVLNMMSTAKPIISAINGSAVGASFSNGVLTFVCR